MPNEPVPTLEAWKAATSVSWRRRSDELRKLDDAIDAYHKAGEGSKKQAFKNIKLAWFAWRAKHTSEDKFLFNNKRDAKGALSFFDRLFSDLYVGDEVQTGQISRVHFQLANGTTYADNPIHLPEGVVKDRIDKAFIEAQIALESVCAKLRQGSGETRELVTKWFGKDTKYSTVKDRFDLLLDHVKHKLKQPANAIQISWNADPNTYASASEGKLSFGRDFFDDNEVSLTNNSSREFQLNPKKAEIQAIAKNARQHNNQAAAFQQIAVNDKLSLDRRARAAVAQQQSNAAYECVFQSIVGTDFTGSWAVISRHLGHPF